MNRIDELRSLLGADAIVDQEPALAAYLTDWRGRYTGRALAVVLPRTTAQVAQVVQWCVRGNTPIVPQGGNTGLVGGATPDGTGRSIVLSTRRLDRVRVVDTINDTLTVEAGCLLQNAQQAALEQGRLFPLSLAAQGSCTIGGNLATNAGGTQVLRYGNARELTLGLEVVLADGSVWDGLRSLRKDNTGYDLKQVFIGSEGTLGIITAATLKLFPLPRSQLVCLLGAPSLSAAIAMLQRSRAGAGAALTAFELMSGECLDLVARMCAPQRLPFVRTYPWQVLLEWSDHDDPAHAARRCEQLCADAIESGEALDAVVSRSIADCASLWKLRESIPEAQARAGGNVKHDISLPLGAIDPFVRRMHQELAQLDPQLQPMVFGHLGDGNLHFNVGAAAGAPAALAFGLEAQINGIVYPEVIRQGGSVSAEHGLGQLRRELAQRLMQPLEWELMRGIKRAIDPGNLLNPGKLI